MRLWSFNSVNTSRLVLGPSHLCHISEAPRAGGIRPLGSAILDCHSTNAGIKKAPGVSDPDNKNSVNGHRDDTPAGHDPMQSRGDSERVSCQDVVSGRPEKRL